MKFGFRELLLIVLLLAIPVGAYIWVFKPADQNMKKQQAAIQNKKQKLENLQNAMSGIKDLDSEVQKLAQAVNFFEGKLPRRHEIHKILEQVTKIADNHQLDTHLFKTLKVKPFASYCEQPIEMEVYGDFDAYYQFLLDVEKLPRITKINKLEIEKDLDNEGAMKAAFTLSIFFDNKTSESS